jgi:protein involved in polysaccharide export with SLBB domain
MTPSRRPIPFCAALLLFCALARGVAAEDAANADILHKGDAILVRIENMGGGLPEYREIVDSEGQIELPFLGFLAAEGKLPAALEAEMAAAYATAQLSTNAIVHLTFITHFDPPPERKNLIRIQDPRRPVPAAETNATPLK